MADSAENKDLSSVKRIFIAHATAILKGTALCFFFMLQDLDDLVQMHWTPTDDAGGLNSPSVPGAQDAQVHGLRPWIFETYLGV